MNSLKTQPVNRPTPSAVPSGTSLIESPGAPAIATTIESIEKSEPMAASLRARIVGLTRESGQLGLTINEAQKQISDHKEGSISARFSELTRSGAIVRVFLGYGQPTRRHPKGVPQYLSRYDEETKRNVTIHWVPKFAPSMTETKLQAEVMGVQ